MVITLQSSLIYKHVNAGFSYGVNHKIRKVFSIVIKYRFINDTTLVTN